MNDLEKVKKFTINVGWVFFASLATAVIGFAIRPILARWLGADALGIYTIVFTLYVLCSIPANVGIGSTMVKYVAQYKRNKETLSSLVSTSIIISVIAGTITAGVLLVFSPLISDFFNMPELSPLIPIVCIVFPLQSMFISIEGVLNGFQKMKQFSILTLMHQVSLVAVSITLVAFGLGLKGAIFGIALSPIPPIIMGVFYLKEKIEWKPRRLGISVRELLMFGGKLATVNAINDINYRIDIIMVGYFLTASDVGYYSVAIVLSRLFWYLPLAIQKITYPATSEYWYTDNRDYLKKMLYKTLKYTTMILVIGGLGLAFFSNEFVGLLFGDNFDKAVLPLHVLLMGTIIRGSIAQPIGNCLSAIGRPDIPMKVSILILAINLPLDVIFIPYMGITGAAIATSISLIVGGLAILALTIRHLEFDINLQWFLGIMILTITAASAFFLGKKIIDPYILGLIILSVYMSILFIFFISIEDKKMIKTAGKAMMPWRR